MGLDMYITKKWYIGANFTFRNITGEVHIEQNGTPIPIKFNRINYISEEVAYWRKANAIHNWFVKNCCEGNDDCLEHYVSLAQIEELVGLCKRILSTSEKLREAEAATLLPTLDGFFFGSTAYDEYYYDDLKNTVKQLEPIITEIKTAREAGFTCSLHYRASW